MKPFRKFTLDLEACELEDRILPVITNLGVIVLTTGGYVLITPYTGAAAYPGGSPGGTAVLTSFSITGPSSGISSVQPGNITGIPGVGTTGAAGSNGGASTTITVGSGTNDATAVIIPLVTRNTIANDALVPLPQVGRPSEDDLPILPAGQSYRGDARETVPARDSSETPGGQSSRSPRQSGVDSTPMPLRGAPPRAMSDVSGHSIRDRADRMP
jgi:hypothetical protein